MEDVETSIPARFEKIVKRYPNRLAVKTSTQQLTYFELSDAANRLAAVLLARSGEHREPIGLLLPKGVPLVISILATLKAGKICVPVDPTFPESRIAQVLDSAQVNLSLTVGEYLPLTKTVGHSTKYLNIDEINFSGGSKSCDISTGPDDFAYIFHTSGSTGLPKGVSENHRNVLFHVQSETNEYHLCPDDRLIFMAASGRDILRALLNGACVYPVDIKKEGLAGLADWLIREQITIFSGVVSAFRGFVGTLDGTERFSHLRLIKLVGEMVYAQDVELYRKYFSNDCILVNSYGPNEAGHVADYFVDKATQITTPLVPVGYNIEGKDLMLFDSDGKEVGPGTIGEITVRSRYLSPGYWRRLDLTHARFRYAGEDLTNRLYFTGDLGVRDASGCLRLTGRQDFQVKIRGNRVEISELEAALVDIEGVKEAVVIASEEVPGAKRLVAYVVPSTKPPPTVKALRKQLAEKLPEYMLPAVFVYLDALPTTGIGKVNRRALPNPGKSRPDLDIPFVAPGNPLEELLVQIWTEVLELDQVGIHDNFFDLGGNSLTATGVVSRIIRHFQLDIPIKRLFESPTVSQMAAVIADYREKRLGSDDLEKILAELESMPDDKALRLVQQGIRKEKTDFHSVSSYPEKARFQAIKSHKNRNGSGSRDGF